MNFGFFGIIDIVIVLAVIIFAILGWKHGFLVKILQMASGLFGIIGSILLARPFSTVLDKWFGDSIGAKITEYLTTQSQQFTVEFTFANRLAAIKEAFPSLPEFMQTWIADAINVEDIAGTIVDTLQPFLKSLALLVIAFVVLFFGSIIVFFILKLIAKGVTKIPVIREVDKVLGVLFGLVKIAAIIMILMFILGLLQTFPAVQENIGGFLEIDMQLSNPEVFRLSKWIYNNNILRDIIGVFI